MKTKKHQQHKYNLRDICNYTKQENNLDDFWYALCWEICAMKALIRVKMLPDPSQNVDSSSAGPGNVVYFWSISFLK